MSRQYRKVITLQQSFTPKGREKGFKKLTIFGCPNSWCWLDRCILCCPTSYKSSVITSFVTVKENSHLASTAYQFIWHFVAIFSEISIEACRPIKDLYIIRYATRFAFFKIEIFECQLNNFWISSIYWPFAIKTWSIIIWIVGCCEKSWWSI